MAMIPIDWNPPRKALRTFGLIGLFAFAGIALLVHYRLAVFARLSQGAQEPTKVVLTALAVYCGFFALAAPAMLRPLYLVLTVASFPIGYVLSYVILFIMFYLIITPIGLVCKLIGRDALNRRFDPAAPTYWIERRPPTTVKRYFRQF